MSYTKKVLQGTVIVFVMSLFSSVFAYLLRVVLARNLSQAEYGLVYSILALFGFFAIFQHMGLNEALIKYIAEFNVKKQFQKIKSAILFVLGFQFLTAAIFGLLGVFLADWLAANYFHDPEAAFLTKIFAISIFLSPTDVLFSVVFQAFQRMDLHSLVKFLRMGFVLLATFVLLRLGFGIVSPMLAYVLVYIFNFVYYPLFTKKVFPEFNQLKFQFDSPLFRKLFAFGIPVIITSFAGLVITYTDTIMITYFRGLEEVALYNASLPTAKLLWMISESLIIVLFPLSTELWLKNKAYLRDGLQLVYKYTLLVVLPAAGVLFVFPETALSLLFGQNYVSASFALQVLSVGAVILTLANINTTVLSGIGKPKLNSKIIVFASVFNIVGNLILIPFFGYVGGAVSTILAFIIILWFNTSALKKFVKIKIPFLSWAKTLFCSIIFILVAVLLKNLLSINVIAELTISLVTASLVYIILLFVTRTVTREEIRGIVGKIRT